MKMLRIKVALFFDYVKNTEKINFKVEHHIEREGETLIPWERTNIFINGNNLQEIIKKYEIFEANYKKNDKNLSGMYDGLSPAHVKNAFKKRNGLISLYQCSECHSTGCGSHLQCKISRGRIFTTLYDFEQKPNTTNICTHEETRVKVFWSYSAFKPFRFYTWQLDKALRNI